MAARKKVSTTVNKTLKTELKLKDNDSVVKWTGILGLGLALIGMWGSQYMVALVAILLGAVSIYMCVKMKNYQYIFLGVAAILIGLNAIWSYASVMLMAAEVSY